VKYLRTSHQALVFVVEQAEWAASAEVADCSAIGAHIGSGSRIGRGRCLGSEDCSAIVAHFGLEDMMERNHSTDRVLSMGKAQR
jgi:hypothetical protein